MYNGGGISTLLCSLVTCYACCGRMYARIYSTLQRQASYSRNNVSDALKQRATPRRIVVLWHRHSAMASRAWHAQNNGISIM